MNDYFFGADGNPFADKQAAEYKLRAVQRQLGDGFEVRAFPSGGWIVAPVVDPEHAEAHPVSSSYYDRAREETQANRITSYVDEDGDDSPELHLPATEAYQRASSLPVLYLRPAPIAFLNWHANATFGLLAAVFPNTPWRILTGLNLTTPELYNTAMQVTFVLGVIIFVIYVIRFLWVYYGHLYIIHPDSIEIHTGIVKRDDNQVFLKDIREFKVKRSIVERLTGVGNVIMSTAATAGEESKIKYVFRPNRLKAELIRRFRLNGGGYLPGDD
jgi:membrane protein YdbS with pleckstrin-like domain